MAIDWGSFPDWLAGGGSVLALVFAGYAARSAYRQVRVIEDDQRRGQAARVAAWYGVVYYKRGDPEDQPSVFFKNFSDVPVYAVLTYVHPPASAGEVEPTEVKGPFLLPPSTRPVTRPLRFATIGPGDKPLDVGMFFRDAAGHHWHRNTDGILGEIPSTEYDERVEALLRFEDRHDGSGRLHKLP